jgi:RNA-binding protein MEX3
MPASLLSEMNGLEDQRALQIALELSMLGLSPEDEANSNHSPGLHPPGPPGAPHGQPFDAQDPHKMKKSANMTECVPVPSSEHVAEIVGRQGCKIKALRAKTNTYIKTPVRGEEPVFVVTGRKEDVAAAKREILSAAEHFSQIRATRRSNNQAGTNPGSLAPGPPSPGTPGQVTIQVRVPYRVVGLVVGPKGATIKRIQQQTHTYIVTPSRDKEPVFDVTGSPENVEKARQEIESHIAMRTGAGLVDSNVNVNSHNHNAAVDDASNDFHTNGVDSGFHDINNDMLSSMYKPPSTNSAFTSYSHTALNSNNILPRNSQDSSIFTFPTLNGSAKMADFPSLSNGFTNSFGLYDNDEGISSPSFDPSQPPLTPSMWPDLDSRNHLPMFSGVPGLPRRSGSMSSNTPRLSPTLTDASSGSNSSEHTTVRRIRSDPLSGGLSAMSAFAPLPQNNFTTSNASISSSTSSSPTDSTGSLRGRRNCLVCSDSDVVAALVPCGHNLFCMECANLIMEKAETERQCPVCHQTPTQAIRIFS